MYTFSLRPGYGSQQLLLEFFLGLEDQAFLTTLEQALAPIHITITGADLWVHEGQFLEVDSTVGSFQITLDHWGLAFILAEGNQQAIHEIDRLLHENPSFTKKVVDFKDYS